MQSAKDMAASAKAGMEKTKATLQEKGEKMTSREPLQKEMATEKKEERISEAERQKREARQHNADRTTDNTGGGLLGGYDDDDTTGTAEEMGGVGRRGTNTGTRTGY